MAGYEPELDRRSPHLCTESNRMDRIETSLEKISLAVSQITDLFVNQATYDIRLTALSENDKDKEKRLRSVEMLLAKNAWVERLTWVVLVGIVATFMKYGG